MPLTMIVTRDVEALPRLSHLGDAGDCAGLHVAPEMSAGVRGRVWSVMTDWWTALGRGALTMVWRDTGATGNLRIETLGEPPREIVDADGVLLGKRA